MRDEPWIHLTMPGGPESLDGDVSVDRNGCLTERKWLGGQEVIVHYDDVPESDLTVVDGIRCTTVLRTVIDIAPIVELDELEAIVTDCLDRGLFTRDEALARTGRPDMRTRPGAALLRRVLEKGGDGRPGGSHDAVGQ